MSSSVGTSAPRNSCTNIESLNNVENLARARFFYIDIMGYIPYNKLRTWKGENVMPTISHFYGIIIVMYLRNKEHNPPHVHAITQDFDAPFLIETGEIMEGEFPTKAKALVKEFIQKYQKELEEMWETEKYVKLPPLN